MEDEYHVLACTAVEFLWHKFLWGELSLQLSKTPIINCDNFGATYLSINSIFHSKMKHIAINFHFMRDHVINGISSYHIYLLKINLQILWLSLWVDNSFFSFEQRLVSFMGAPSCTGIIVQNPILTILHIDIPIFKPH